MASIREIAKVAKVSVSTASKALNDKKDVSEKTRLHVKEIASQMGYSPNPIAKRLSAKKKNLIGVLVLHTDVLEIGGSIFMKILGEISRRAARKGYDILLMTPEKDMSYMEMAKKRHVDGVIIMGLTLSDKNLSEIKKSTLPMMILDQYVEGKVCVSTDNYKGIREVMAHLTNSGVENIAFAGYYEGSQASVERYEAYCKYRNRGEKKVYKGGFSYEDGLLMGKEIVKDKKIPGAIVCSTDMVALGIIKILKKNNIIVPKDVLVSGFDNLISGRISTPELTTVSQDTIKISKNLLEGLVDLIDGKEIKDKLIDGSLIIRESTGG